MDSSPIEEMIRMGIEYFLVGIFLVFLVQAIGLRNDFAAAKNNQTDTTRQIQAYRSYSKYNQGSNVYGDDIIEAIRAHTDGSLEIYVNYVGPGKGALHFTREEAENNPEKYSVSNLQNTLSLTKEYRPYLIYNGNDPTNPVFYKEDMGEVTGIAFILVGGS